MLCRAKLYCYFYEQKEKNHLNDTYLRRLLPLADGTPSSIDVIELWFLAASCLYEYWRNAMEKLLNTHKQSVQTKSKTWQWTSVQLSWVYLMNTRNVFRSLPLILIKISTRDAGRKNIWNKTTYRNYLFVLSNCTQTCSLFLLADVFVSSFWFGYFRFGQQTLVDTILLIQHKVFLYGKAQANEKETIKRMNKKKSIKNSRDIDMLERKKPNVIVNVESCRFVVYLDTFIR